MTRPEVKPFDVASAPELLRLAREVKVTGQPYILKKDEEALALLSPLESAPRTRKTGLVSKSDSLWNIVGIGNSEEPHDVSRNKHKYLAEAYVGRSQ